jgi:DNA polymerase IV
MRKILHIDMDAFYASVEQRDDPTLRDRPVVVAWRGARSVVCAASYEARRFGVRSAMPAVRAERLCPDLVFVAPDFTRYRSVSKQVRAIFARHTDLIDPLSLDEAYLDVTVNKQGLASATAVAESIRASIRDELELTASAGVASNKFLAKIASDWNKPNGIFVIRPGQALDFLAPLPLSRLPGVGKVMERRLAEAGFGVVADLRGRALDLERRFGRWGLRLHELAHGIDEHPVVTERPTQSVSSEDTFEADLLLDELTPHIERLAARTWASARKESRIARTVVLKLKTARFKVLTRSFTPPHPVASESELVRLACDLRERVGLPVSTRFRLVGVGLSNFQAPESMPSGQAALFDPVD